MLRLMTLLIVLAPWLPGDIVMAAPVEGLMAGIARTDITPTEPLRLSGYGNRTEPAEGTDEQLFARAMALREGTAGPLLVLVSVDTIGFPGTLTKAIHERIEAAHGIPRANFVICCTHSHTAPHIADGLVNLFAVPLSDTEREATARYTSFVADQIVDVVGKAIADLKPARIFHATGEASFAVNRRVLEGGIWKGFGVNPAGPVDHSLPLLKITDPSGQTVRGLLFNYACHCTTFGGDYNRVNGDWAGYAAKFLEQAHPGAGALCTIGCGADQNPSRDSAKALEFAQAQGREIADAVGRLITGPMQEITAGPRSSYGYAGLPIDRPELDELRASLSSERAQVRQHAENMLAINDLMGRLPETYPMPVQVWRFGHQFAMVFLGGEVCVDYAHRIKRELTPKLTDVPATSLPVWVTAYANDVFGYVASERMRSEGGYEVDFSMIYYNQPGRWSSGAEDVILRRVHEMFENTGKVGPLPPAQALETFTLPAGFRLDVIAAEPLIRDPIHMALGPDGRLWVVEMGDYPWGDPEDNASGPRGPQPWDGSPGGRIRVLTDTDGDGRFDAGVTFLEGLTFPTGILPWRDGALVSGAPDVIFARDTDGDGRADEQEVLFSGFDKANPQHRVSGFTVDIDNWVYLAAGTNNETITSTRNGAQVNIAGRDCRIHPDDGRIEPVSGRSQFGRCRTDWGDWFGNQNSEPLFHFAIEDRYLQQNPYVPAPSPKVFLTEPAHAPPVYPTSRTLDRFNDLFALDRFTSACSPHVIRDARWASQLAGDATETALVCEPVHNLISRVMLIPDSVTYRGVRHPDEQQSEFLSSTDNWFRPVNVTTAPDGSLWICDMYREVIEHPEWIPLAWQAQLNMYAGSDRGRIYRLARDDQPPASLPDLTSLQASELVEQLASDNGWHRDTAQRLLVERGDPSAIPLLEALATSHASPLARIHALGTLEGLGKLSSSSLTQALNDADSRVVRWAIRFCEPRLATEPALADAITPLATYADLHVRYQVALALGLSTRPGVANALMQIALEDPGDRWIRAAVLCSSRPHAANMTKALLTDRARIASRSRLLQDLIATALGDDVTQGAEDLIGTIAAARSEGPAEDWQLVSLSSCLDALQRRNVSWRQLSEQTRRSGSAIFTQARELARDPAMDVDRRALAARLLGQESTQRETDIEFLYSLLSPREATDIQLAALQALARLQPEDLVPRLLEQWRSAGPSLRAELISTLLSRERWLSLFLDALAAGDVSPGDIDPATRLQLVSHSRRPIRDRARRLWGNAADSDRQEVLATYEPAKSLAGDPARGAPLFQKVCSSCHRHAEIGNELGPKLSALQNKSAEALLIAILDPNQAVEQKYRGYVLLTKYGRSFSGLIKSETANSLTLADPQGKEHVILRIDIEELSGTGKSFMPEGLEKDLAPQDLADLMAFLRSDS